jgi:prepilin-type processing-associated H-X9-DG protein
MSRRRYVDLGCLLGMAIFLGVFVYPIFPKASALAAKEQCNCNLKELTLAALMYAQDNDQRLPNALRWVPSMLTYSSNTERYVCPKDSRCPWLYPFTLRNHPPNLDFISYDMLQRWSYQKLPPQGQARNEVRDRPMNEVEHVERAVLLYEVGRQGLDYRHFGGMQIGFLDGHVKWYSKEEMTPAIILSGNAPAAKP